ncbi:VCBS repeat-containing protein, partial [Kitasatospora sp. NPDC057936]
MRTSSSPVRAVSVMLAIGLSTIVLGSAPVHAQSNPGIDYVIPGQGIPPTALTARAAAQISRSEVLARAQSWVGLGLPYSWDATHDGYRQDCSGYASMAWRLGTPGLDTTSFIPGGVASKIEKSQLKPGDALLNDAAGKDGHIVLFDRWADDAHSSYVGYEFSGSGVHHRTIPYPYFPDYIRGNGYVPVHNNSVVDDATPPSNPQVPASSLVSGRVATVYNPDTKTSEAFAIDTAG